jgi:hypothetical protein
VPTTIEFFEKKSLNFWENLLFTHIFTKITLYYATIGQNPIFSQNLQKALHVVEIVPTVHIALQKKPFLLAKIILAIHIIL